MEYALIDVADTLIVQVVLVYGMTRIMPMRHVGLFWALSICGNVAVQIGGTYVANMGFLSGFVVLALLQVALPIALYEGPLARRVAVTCLAVVCSGLAEAVFYAVFGAVTGADVPDEWSAFLISVGDNVAAWLLAELARACALLALLFGVREVVRRTGQARGGSSSREDGRLGIDSTVFATLAASQGLLVGGMLFVFAFFEVSSVWSLATAGVFVLLLAVDAASLVALERSEAKAREDQKARDAQRRLSEYLAESDEAMAQVRAVAHVRHDMRNELAVAIALAERGERDRASDLLDALAHRIAEAGSDAGSPSDAETRTAAEGRPRTEAWAAAAEANAVAAEDRPRAEALAVAAETRFGAEAEPRTEARVKAEATS